MQGAQSRRLKSVAYLMTCVILCAAVAYGLIDNAIWPDTTGEHILSDDNLTVNVSHADLGYIAAKSTQTDKKLKLRVEKDDYTLTYDLNNEGNYEIFPLQLGNGAYTFTLYQNVSGNKYAQAGGLQADVTCVNDYVCFLTPNQYVNYTPDSPAVQISDELCQNMTQEEDKFQAVRKYIRENYTYDFDRARNLSNAAGILPDIQYCIENRKGICQDLAAMAACMLRVQGIPTKLVIGYVDQYYHAWNIVLIDGKEILYDPTLELGGIPENLTYTTERFY